MFFAALMRPATAAMRSVLYVSRADWTPPGPPSKSLAALASMSTMLAFMDWAATMDGAVSRPMVWMVRRGCPPLAVAGRAGPRAARPTKDMPRRADGGARDPT